jgi:hypothetical protein
LSDQRLDDILENFYLEIRNKSGQLYKQSTMNSYRQGLQRHLNQNRDIDILKGDAFKKSIKAFKCIGKFWGRIMVWRSRRRLCTFCFRCLTLVLVSSIKYT